MDDFLATVNKTGQAFPGQPQVGRGAGPATAPGGMLKKARATAARGAARGGGAHVPSAFLLPAAPPDLVVVDKRLDGLKVCVISEDAAAARRAAAAAASTSGGGGPAPPLRPRTSRWPAAEVQAAAGVPPEALAADEEVAREEEAATAEDNTRDVRRRGKGGGGMPCAPTLLTPQPWRASSSPASSPLPPPPLSPLLLQSLCRLLLEHGATCVASPEAASQVVAPEGVDVFVGAGKVVVAIRPCVLRL